MMGGPKPRKRHALPPGLELLLKTHPPSTSEQSSGSGSSRGTIVFTPFTSLVLPIHWSVIRCIAENRNFRLLSNHAKNRNPRGVGRDPEKSKEEPDGPTSELPPANWSDLVYTDPKTGIKSIELEYKELTAGYKYVVTVIEVVPDEKLYVVCKSDYGDTDKNIESERRTSARKLSTFTWSVCLLYRFMIGLTGGLVCCSACPTTQFVRYQNRKVGITSIQVHQYIQE